MPHYCYNTRNLISRTKISVSPPTATPSYIYNLNHTTPPNTPELYADSGASGIYLPTTYASHLSSSPSSLHQPITIQQPDGRQLTSTASGNFNIPNIPSAATQAHIFPNLTVGLAGLPQLCDNDLSITLTKRDISIYNPHGKLLLKHPRTGSLWTLPTSFVTTPGPSPPPTLLPPPAALQHAYNLFPIPKTNAGKCLYYQQCLGSPTKAGMVNAALNGYLTRAFPELTPAFLRKNYVETLATAQASLQRSRKNLRSHKAPTVTSESKSTSTDSPLPDSKPQPPHPGPKPTTEQLISVFVASSDPSLAELVNYTDATAAFPHTNCHWLITYSDTLNYVKASAVKDFTGATFLKHYTSHIEDFETAKPGISYCPTIEVMDNVMFTDLRKYFKRKKITAQLVPPGSHRANNAERAIQTFKKALISALATANPDFPLEAVEHITPQVEFNINMLRPSRVDPSMSAFEYLYGPYNSDRWPLVPIGAKGLVYETAEQRALGSFGPHGVVGFYVGRAIDHYGCYTMYIPETKALRVTDSIYWLPHNPDYPRYECLPHNIFAGTRLPPLPGSSGGSIIQTSHSSAAPSSAIALTNATTTPAPVPQDATTAVAPVSILEGANTITPSPASPIQPSIAPRTSTPASATAATDRVSNSAQSPASRRTSSHLWLTPPPTNAGNRSRRQDDPEKGLATAFYSHYERTIAGPNLTEWKDSMVRELTMLTKRFKDGLVVVSANDVPRDERKCPFLNPVTREKLDSSTGTIIDLRTRLTWGKEPPAADPTANSSSVAASAVVKLLLNSAVSDPNSTLSSIDLDYFYYQTRRTDPKYARMHVRLIPPAGRQLLGIAHLSDDATIYLRANIAIPGQPDAGKLAQQALIAHLAPHGYVMCEHTPCLFRHVTRKSIHFPIHVDDILVKHNPKTSDYAHLTAALREVYTIKEQTPARSFCGIRIDLKRDLKNSSRDSISISVPGGVHRALKRLGFTPTSNPGSPMLYTPPSYSSADQLEVTDTSPPASAADRQFLMESVGYFRWYSPAVDPCLLPAVSHLAIQQSSPTHKTMQELDRFLNYAYHHPNACITYYPSDMQLYIHSDCSHHSESNARSRTGIFMTCGKPKYEGPDKPHWVNGAVDVISVLLSHVTASVSESEYGALFVSGTSACPHRQCLEDLNHPQKPCEITYDNEVAGKVANGTAKIKRSKSIAKCFHWIRDRITKGEYILTWGPGKYNLGDYFSKAHAVHHHASMRPLYVSDRDIATSIHAVLFSKFSYSSAY